MKNVGAAYNEVADRTLAVANSFIEQLIRYSASRDTNDWERLRNSSAEFSKWISSRRSGVKSNLDAAYSGKILYLSPAELSVDPGPTLDQIEEINQRLVAAPPSSEAGIAASGKLFALANEARGRAERIAVLQTLSPRWEHSWQESYRQYLRLLLISVAALFALCGWLVYQIGLIPLRRRLVESTATIERQQKLAHFGELAAGLAHEIRNPLTAINARLYTLQKSLPNGAPATDDAGFIHTEINRLDRILKDFLKLARPSEPQFASVQARTLLDEVSQLLSAPLQEQRIELKLDATADVAFRADPQQLKQVLINLVHNAADAIGTDGTITLSARTDVQKLHGRSREVAILEVADTGPGMTPEVLAHLFDPFFSTKDEGTGLGLPISERIVDQHGGKITVKTDGGKGTSFGIVVPVAQEADETKSSNH